MSLAASYWNVRGRWPRDGQAKYWKSISTLVPSEWCTGTYLDQISLSNLHLRVLKKYDLTTSVGAAKMLLASIFEFLYIMGNIGASFTS